ncbi:spore protein [Bacillus sonorensis]|uniref:Small acid-soluble spore protein n=1 Tax=Bacillus sonorensis L12 TaxID=1274524 RepID=M5PAD4_9BACI|nr:MULTISPECIES: acid-soluble spore protein SspM [Bacillus]EME76443.1 small acid-soluble spore protein [Bacillus sonorensis L12]MBG9915448.1 spore protein [Bacillus sonorensis]MCF7618102.1 spore protein [Bacillus sonorensis]MCY7856822.1 spore protein [Bacillus sonorensis]MCY8024381.1 spore protein [Bacillus sonorensis]
MENNKKKSPAKSKPDAKQADQLDKKLGGPNRPST